GPCRALAWWRAPARPHRAARRSVQSAAYRSDAKGGDHLVMGRIDRLDRFHPGRRLGDKMRVQEPFPDVRPAAADFGSAREVELHRELPSRFLRSIGVSTSGFRPATGTLN